MFLDSISNVIFCSPLGTSQRSYAGSSMVMASVSTFQDHRATPAARVAARRCFSCHKGIVTWLGNIALCFPACPTKSAPLPTGDRQIPYPVEKVSVRLRGRVEVWSRARVGSEATLRKPAMRFAGCYQRRCSSATTHCSANFHSAILSRSLPVRRRSSPGAAVRPDLHSHGSIRPRQQLRRWPPLPERLRNDESCVPRRRSGAICSA